MATDNSVPRITELRIKGLRTLEDVTLKLGNVNVLIGENGCGKSSVVEAVRLLQLVVTDSLKTEFFQAHGGFSDLQRRDATEIVLSVVVEGALLACPVQYSIELRELSDGFGITDERLVMRAGRDETGDVAIFLRHRHEALINDAGDARRTIKVPRDRSLLSLLRDEDRLGSMQAVVDAVRGVLERIEVHLPFATEPRWALRALGWTFSMRNAAVIEPTERLPFAGLGLVNAYHHLKNELSREHWETTMDYVRLGLGQDIESINTRADAGGGSIGLTLKRRGVERQESAYVLSDGMLAYLAFVAIFRLEAPTSLLAFDEPDVHLHPSLLARVVGFAESIGERCPVLITTHSDRLLDYLSDPVGSAVLMELDEKRATRLLRPDPGMYAKWMDRYAGLGDIRADGAERSIFTREDGAAGVSS